MNDDILVVGGYGVVGHRLSALLASRLFGRVVIGGRREQRAIEAAQIIGRGTRGRRVELDDASSIDAGISSASLVVNAVSDRSRRLLRAAIARGVAYVDLCPALASLHDHDTLHASALASGARVVLGAGLSPGISSAMACAAVQQVTSPHTLDVHVLLSLADDFGPDSMAFVRQECVASFQRTEGGARRDSRAFGERCEAAFPGIGRRAAYLFPFSDTFSMPQALGLSTVRTWLSIEPPWVGGLLHAVLPRLGSRHEARLQGASAVLSRAARRLSNAAPLVGLLVTARGRTGACSYGMLGRHQAGATAIGAAGVVDCVLRGDVVPGCWLAERVVEPATFFSGLAREGLQVRKVV